MSIWGASWVLDVLFLDLGGGYSPSNYTFVFRNFNGYLIKLSHAHTYAHSGKQCPARSWYVVLHPPPPVRSDLRGTDPDAGAEPSSPAVLVVSDRQPDVRSAFHRLGLGVG